MDPSRWGSYAWSIAPLKGSQPQKKLESGGGKKYTSPSASNRGQKRRGGKKIKAEDPEQGEGCKTKALNKKVIRTPMVPRLQINP